MISSALAIFLVSLLAFPMTYVTNAAQSLHGELGLFVTGVICLSLVCYLVYLALAAAPGTKDGRGGRGVGGGGHDWLLYVFTLGTFASVVDLIIGLETDGIVKGFMSVYLRNGEPYLGTPYGALISYWDGTAHYAMYLYMLAAMTYRWNYRHVGLYWAGSIGHSMLILVPGAILGQYGVRWSFLLNVPYIFIPFMSAARFLKDGQSERKKKSNTDTHTPAINQSVVASDSLSIWKRPVDLSLCLLLVTSIAICLHRGFAVLGCRHEIATTYLDFYEPYLKDPVVFPKIQMLVYLFYFVPFYIAALYALLHRGCAWLPDWSILFAGASAQAQIPHILGSLHPRTWPDFQVPGHESAQIVFWSVNLLLLVTPHLLVLRCWRHPRRFNLQSPTDDADGSQPHTSDANRKNN